VCQALSPSTGVGASGKELKLQKMLESERQELKQAQKELMASEDENNRLLKEASALKDKYYFVAQGDHAPPSTSKKQMLKESKQEIEVLEEFDTKAHLAKVMGGGK